MLVYIIQNVHQVCQLSSSFEQLETSRKSFKPSFWVCVQNNLKHAKMHKLTVDFKIFPGEHDPGSPTIRMTTHYFYHATTQIMN